MIKKYLYTWRLYCPETFWSLYIAVQYEMELLSINWPGKECNIGRWVLEAWRDFQTGSVVQLQPYPMDISSGVPKGAFGASSLPPEIPKSLHNRAKKKTRLWKLLKIAEFRTPTPQDVWKKNVITLPVPVTVTNWRDNNYSVKQTSRFLSSGAGVVLSATGNCKALRTTSRFRGTVRSSCDVTCRCGVAS